MEVDKNEYFPRQFLIGTNLDFYALKYNKLGSIPQNYLGNVSCRYNNNHKTNRERERESTNRHS